MDDIPKILSDFWLVDAKDIPICCYCELCQKATDNDCTHLEFMDETICLCGQHAKEIYDDLKAKIRNGTQERRKDTTR